MKILGQNVQADKGIAEKHNLKTNGVLLSGLLTGVWFTMTRASMPSALFSNSIRPVLLRSDFEGKCLTLTGRFPMAFSNSSEISFSVMFGGALKKCRTLDGL